MTTPHKSTNRQTDRYFAGTVSVYSTLVLAYHKFSNVKNVSQSVKNGGLS